MLNNLEYADENILLAENEFELQQMMNHLSQISNTVCLKINTQNQRKLQPTSNEEIGIKLEDTIQE